MSLFDNWARHYDIGLRGSEGSFPFDGYEDVLEEAVRLADVKPQMRILDLGIGTGNLAEHLVGHGCTVWGVDFSTEMLKRTRAKLPEVRLVQADLLGAWPSELPQRFDRVVSAYVLHEFDLATKIGLIQRIVSQHLSAAGHLVVADIAFPSVEARAEAAERLAGLWDEDEFYWAADESIAVACEAGLRTSYRQISSCGGVFTFRRSP
jgi:cyclopropane fatty-acyl-phospholipid synthase-like methyltransferase